VIISAYNKENISQNPLMRQTGNNDSLRENNNSGVVEAMFSIIPKKSQSTTNAPFMHKTNKTGVLLVLKYKYAIVTVHWMITAV
jgi:hypothetical protein